jgi:hypothetical protein
MRLMTRLRILVAMALGAVFAEQAPAQQIGSRLAPRLPPLAVPAANPYANQAAGLRAVPLPQRSLPSFSPFAGPVRAPYALPYGPRYSRPAGSPVVPFGSSGYYYHR